jgi:CMP-N-acetylneuraminic acid synthetase
MFTAIIPVRASSRRLPNKNIMPFGGKNLLTYKIEQLLKVDEVENIIVSSDSDEMLEMAKLYRGGER